LNGDSLVLRKPGEQCALCEKAVAGDNYVRFTKTPNKEIILCDSCYGFLWGKFKEDETKEKIRRIK